MITDIDPPFARPGDHVTITGSNFIADGSRMTVTFQHAIAEIVDDPGNSDTQLEVAVPHGAYSGGVLICIASDNCSDPFQYYVRYEPQGFLASPSLSSIAAEPGTRSLWFGDRTQGFGRVYEIVPAGEVFERGALARSILAHPSPDDGSGRVYFCNSTNSTGNQGTILYVDSATNQEEFHRAAGAAQSDPVWCRAIAANDLEPDVAYYVDGHHNTVRRVPKTGPINTMYGGQSFNFTDPAGARFDSAGDLYLTSTTQIVKIAAGGSGVQVVASGFTAAAARSLPGRAARPRPRLGRRLLLHRARGLGIRGHRENGRGLAPLGYLRQILSRTEKAAVPSELAARRPCLPPFATDYAV